MDSRRHSSKPNFSPTNHPGFNPSEESSTPLNRRVSRDSRHHASSSSLDAASYGVLTGAVGGSFGPFPRTSSYSPAAQGSYRDSIASSDVAVDVLSPTLSYEYGRNSPPSDEEEEDRRPMKDRLAEARKSVDATLLWDKQNAEVDDYLHEPDADLDRYLDRQMASYSVFGVINTLVLCVLIIVLVGLFAGWPIYRYVLKGGFPDATTDLDGNTIPGQVPNITGLPGLIDATTPESAYARTGFDGKTYNLVFSDEFNTDGRTFWPGDDPWWEAVDLHYWGTKDLEWYDPDAIITNGGNLEITLSEEPIHGLNFRSGMLQSWNKFCFTGGYIELNMSFPGTPTGQGFWPAAWTMGNLARSGYGASNDGMWPYSYSTCDVGTLPNQTYPNGTTPTAAKTSGSSDYGGELSYLPGQRASACTCPGEDHPGPDVSVGRGAPEIDITEQQIAPLGDGGSASQSIQMAPIDAGYLWLNTTPYIEVWNSSITYQNQWHGAVTQESMSVYTLTDKTSYNGAGYSTFGYEYDPGPSGRITWAINGSQTWRLNADAMGPNAAAEIDQRLVSEEPMYINLNLAISESFQAPEWGKIEFPGVFRIDYVRVYQTGKPNIGCDPADHPTSDYINNHQSAYMNPNLTVWGDTNYTVPKNRLSATGCS